MEYVIQEVNFYLSLDQIHSLNKKIGYIGIEGGKVRWNVSCVGMSVRM